MKLQNYYDRCGNKIAHGDFIGLENKIEEYAQKVMDGKV